MSQQQLQQSQGSSTTTTSLKIEKPTQNSVVIEGSKQSILTNSPQKQQKKTIIQRKQLVTEIKNECPVEGEDFSLTRNSYVFSHQKTFNETNLFELGIDLSSDKPILPKLKSIVSELPFGEASEYEIPEIYKEIEIKNPEEAEEMFISKATVECLLFIFYCKPRTKSQLNAAKELEKRGFTFKNQKWFDKEGRSFDSNKWAFDEAKK